MSGSLPVDPILDIDRIKDMVAQVDEGVYLAPDRCAEILETFESYECWAPFFRLLRRNIATPSSRQLADYVRLARAQNLYLEDVAAAAESLAGLVADLKLPYRQFTEEVLPQVLEFESYAAEAVILSAVCDHFTEQSDFISALERLCMIYEKKTHNETQLTGCYEKLLEADQTNLKALRYFKLMLTQANEWEEVIGILRTMLSCVKHPQELYRVAQELAAIYLYQLDMPKEAISTLENYCTESPLDTSTIHFDAYQRLSNWAGCLKVLRQCLRNITDAEVCATLHYKMGNLHEQLNDAEAALESYIQAATLAPLLFDAVEGIISIALAKQDWVLVQSWLEILSRRVQDETLVAQLRQASQRLQDGLMHAKT